MRIRSLLLGSMAAAGLAMALAIAPASAYDPMSVGPSIDASSYNQSFVDPINGGDILVNPAGSLTMHGSGLVDLVGIEMVAMNDALVDNAWLSIGSKLYGATGKYLLNDEIGLGVPLGGNDVIQMIPYTGDIAMVKDDAACAPVASGDVLGHVMVFGALGWSSSSAISAAGCNINNAQLSGLSVG